MLSAKRRPLRSFGDHVVFFREFLKNPEQVASAIPSSRALERRIASVAEVESARAVVELGAGMGGITRAILRRMPSDGSLLSIEINPQFKPALHRIGDSRLLIHTGCAGNLEKVIKRYDQPPPHIIIAGIPFSKIPRTAAVELLNAISRALVPGGRFVAYQLRDNVEALCRPIFGPATVERELWNIPPLRIFRWQK